MVNALKILSPVKNLLVPDRPAYRKILFGLNRGARMHLNPRTQLWIVLGLYEREISRKLRRAVREDDVCYDVGAGDGYYTLALRKLAPKGRVVAIDPNDTRREKMERTLAENGVKDPEVKVLDLFVGDHVDPAARFETLDHLVYDKGLPAPSFIKMDIEGGELAALRGAARVIRERKPRMVIEIHSLQLLKDCTELLTAVGYSVETIDLNRLLRDQGDIRWIVALPK